MTDLLFVYNTSVTRRHIAHPVQPWRNAQFSMCPGRFPCISENVAANYALTCNLAPLDSLPICKRCVREWEKAT